MRQIVSRRGKMAVKAVKVASHFPIVGKRLQDGSLRKRLEKMEPPWKCPEHLQLFTVELEHATAELLVRKAKVEYVQENKIQWEAYSLEGAMERFQSKGVILQLHGGGYYGGFRNKYRNIAALYNEVSDNMAVFSLDYRVAPEHPYPAALEDAIAAYEWLLDNGFGGRIVIAGDSAGGGLTLALALWLRDHEYQMPKAIVTMSAWTDLTKRGESYAEKFEEDPLFGGNLDSLVYKEGYYVNDDPTNPYISPIFGDYTGFPPMLMQVGELEMLLSDTESVAEKAKCQGVEVFKQTYGNMYHVFQLGELLYEESKEAWVQIGRFLRKYVGSTEEQ